MIDPNSLTDPMRAEAERLVQSGQFDYHHAYQQLGARVIAGDPGLSVSAGEQVTPAATPETQLDADSLTLGQHIAELKKLMPPAVPSTDKGSFRKRDFDTYLDNVMSGRETYKKRT
jgi:hypothetical protein